MAVVDESRGTLVEDPDLLSGAALQDVRDPFAADSVAEPEVRINLFDWVQTLARGRRLLVWGMALGCALGIVIYLLTPATFTAEATFLPPQQQQQSALGALGALFQSQMQNDSTDVYLALLASRSVMDEVVAQTHVMERFKTHSPAAARGQLKRMSKFTVSKNQLITVAVKDPDPGFAAQVANAFLEALYRQNGLMATSASSHREQFFKGQLQQQKDDLTEAEAQLRATQEKTGLVLPEGEAVAGISATSGLQAQINAAQTRLAGLRAGLTEQSPDVIEAREELASLRGELARQQAATGARRPGGGPPSTSELPALTLENLRRRRDVKVQETLYESLLQQYERARQSSVDPGPQLQIVDRAIRPERKSAPNGLLYTLGGAVLGGLLAVGGLMLAGPSARFRRDYRRYTRERTAQV